MRCRHCKSPCDDNKQCEYCGIRNTPVATHCGVCKNVLGHDLKPGYHQCSWCGIMCRIPCRHEAAGEALGLSVDMQKYDPFTLYRNDSGYWTSYYGDCKNCGELWTHGKPSSLK